LNGLRRDRTEKIENPGCRRWVYADVGDTPRDLRIGRDTIVDAKVFSECFAIQPKHSNSFPSSNVVVYHLQSRILLAAKYQDDGRRTMMSCSRSIRRISGVASGCFLATIRYLKPAS